MTNWLKPVALGAGIAILAALIIAPVIAQQAGPGPSGPSQGSDGPPRVTPDMMSPDMMGRGDRRRPEGGERSCGEHLAYFTQQRLARIERAVRPSDTQRTAFEDLKSGAARAVEAVKAACPAERAFTAPGRLEAAEKHLDAMLQALRIVRPALESFYQSLSDDQKARLNMATARREHRWDEGWRERWREGARRLWGDRSGDPDRAGRWRDDEDRGGRWRDRGGDDGRYRGERFGDRDGGRFGQDRRGDDDRGRWRRDRGERGDRSFGDDNARGNYNFALGLQRCLQNDRCRQEFYRHFSEDNDRREFRWRDENPNRFRLWRENAPGEDEDQM